MKIGIIGSGNIGANAARLFVRAGHDVALSNSRGGEGLEELVAELGGNTKATTIEDAARFAEVLLVAIPFGKFRTLPADGFKGKVVIDAGNYYPERDGKIAELDADDTTSSELMSAHLKEARLVKGFNTIYFKHLATRAIRAGHLMSGARSSSPEMIREPKRLWRGWLKRSDLPLSIQVSCMREDAANSRGLLSITRT